MNSALYTSDLEAIAARMLGFASYEAEVCPSSLSPLTTRPSDQRGLEMNGHSLPVANSPGIVA